MQASSGKPTEGWRQPSQDCCTRLAREKSVQNNERVQDVYCSRQLFSSKKWFLAKETKSKNVEIPLLFFVNVVAAIPFSRSLSELTRRIHAVFCAQQVFGQF